MVIFHSYISLPEGRSFLQGTRPCQGRHCEAQRACGNAPVFHCEAAKWTPPEVVTEIQPCHQTTSKTCQTMAVSCNWNATYSYLDGSKLMIGFVMIKRRENQRMPILWSNSRKIIQVIGHFDRRRPMKLKCAHGKNRGCATGRNEPKVFCWMLKTGWWQFQVITLW